MKKIVLALLAISLGLSSGLAMSKSEPAETPKTAEVSQQSEKLVDIYAKDDQSSEVKGQIGLNNQDNYNIFTVSKITGVKLLIKTMEILDGLV
ncbi:hypothetical protein ACP8HZ_02940 [Francisella noatunensis]